MRIADTKRKSLSGKFSKAVAAGVTAATVLLSSATALAAAPKAPGENQQTSEQQTASTVSKTYDETQWTPEQRKVFHDVQQDLRNADIKPATYMAPFPDPDYKSFPAEFEVIGDTPGKTTTLLIGAGAGETEWVEQTHATDCSQSVFVNNDTFQRFRTLVYLHETGHEVDYAFGLTKPVREAMDAAIKGPAVKNVAEEKLPQNLQDMNANIQERYADTTAVLYALSNMKDAKPLVASYYNLRNASILEEADKVHNTASSIKYAEEAYEKNPRPGLSIVDAAEWSAKLIGQEQNMIIKDQNEWLPTRVLQGSLSRTLTGAPTSFDVKVNEFMNGGDYKSALKNWYGVQKSEEGLCAAPPQREAQASVRKTSIHMPRPG